MKMAYTCKRCNRELSNGGKKNKMYKVCGVCRNNKYDSSKMENLRKRIMEELEKDEVAV